MRRGLLGGGIASVLATLGGMAGSSITSLRRLGDAAPRITKGPGSAAPDKARSRVRTRVRYTGREGGRSKYDPHSSKREAARHAARGMLGFVDWKPAPSGEGHDFMPGGLASDRAADWAHDRGVRRIERREAFEEAWLARLPANLRELIIENRADKIRDI